MAGITTGIITIVLVALCYFILVTNVDILEISAYWALLPILIAPFPVFQFLMRKYNRRKKIMKQPFPEAWEQILNQRVAYYTALEEDKKEQFRNEVKIFLNEKKITGIETTVDDESRVLVAASAIIPAFTYPDLEYDNVKEILLYPRSFDDSFNFKEAEARILGMVGIGSAMILSKQALITGFKNPDDKHNVGIHEFLHKLDEMDGLIDGVPAALIKPEIEKQWQMIMQQEMDLMRAGQSDINPYGLTNEAEFFAVVGEYFFENPQTMKRKHPELYNILTAIFKQDTYTLLKNTMLDLFGGTKKKIRRNAPCPCGSGKKYKHCCLKNAK